MGDLVLVVNRHGTVGEFTGLHGRVTEIEGPRPRRPSFRLVLVSFDSHPSAHRTLWFYRSALRPLTAIDLLADLVRS